ncbi:hypothetical protein RHSIM_Rhsim05G0046200 [Rhododendron simsii]|uniref:Uncharacterized protein n=1 Tax=Rhododendron simsii TaxID=118357 RepID=A0A834H8R5_RHOSS|nr:hypothetical protein RHSIM_Rhsim05G0046200 [Rhododendron simsii]
MHNVDLRLVVPALINLTLFLLQHHHYQAAGKYPTFNMNPNSWFFAIVVLMLFLTTSVKLPLSVTTERIRVRAGDFSFFVAISLLGSVCVPQPLFWFGYVVIICVSPWHGVLSGLLVGFLFWIWYMLRGIPVFIITCIVQNHQQEDETETDHASPQVILLVADDDDIGSGNPIFLDQPTSEPNTVLVVEP